MSYSCLTTFLVRNLIFPFLLKKKNEGHFYQNSTGSFFFSPGLIRSYTESCAVTLNVYSICVLYTLNDGEGKWERSSSSPCWSQISFTFENFIFMREIYELERQRDWHKISLRFFFLFLIVTLEFQRILLTCTPVRRPTFDR